MIGVVRATILGVLLIAAIAAWGGRAALATPQDQIDYGAQSAISTQSPDGMVAITDPRVDPAGTLADATWIPQLVDPSAGPIIGSTELGSEFQMMPAGVHLQDVYALLTFMTPMQAPDGAWSVGFGFWSDLSGNFYDLFVQVEEGTATWNLGHGTADGAYQVLQSGPLADAAIDLTPGAENDLALVVYQGIAILSGTNHGVDAVAELPARPLSGDVFAEVGFTAANPAETATLPMSVHGFLTWDMSGGMVPDVLSIPSGSVGPSSY